MRIAILYLCFFLSGMAGLIYEVLWTKYLALCVGSTGVAQIVVLATFMGGMAIGSHLFGRVADKTRNPLKLYAYLELAAGAYALLFDGIFVLVRKVFISIATFSVLDSGGIMCGKVLTAVLAILLPSLFLGGTFPAMGRHMVKQMHHLGPRIARLYFLNSLGAVAGCVLAGFFLVRSFGLHLSMVIGAGFSITAALISLMLREERYIEAPAGAADEAYADEFIREDASSGWGFYVVLACVSLSGAVSMMYEVAWIRLLTLVLGSTTYSFSIMLATFILGLSIGGFILSLKKKSSGYTVIFGLSEASVGLVVLLMLPFYVRLPYVFNQIAVSLSREPATFPVYQMCKFMLCAIVMIIPTILQGITLPAATKVLMQDVSTLGRRVGGILAINTAGTLAGAVGAGVWGLPVLGIKGTLELAAGLNCILALAILYTKMSACTRRRLIPATVFVMAIVWTWYFTGMGSWNRNVMSAGVYRNRERIPSYAELLEEASKRKTIFYKDGIDATIAVQDVSEPYPQRVLVINGKVDASTGGDIVTQKMMGHLAPLLSGNIDDVLVIGAGSGASAGAVLCYDVKTMDVVEISQDVIDASRLFESINGGYLNDPRVRVYCEDAKTFLQITKKKYNMINSYPTNPWIAGVAGIFSLEYFEDCRAHLAEGGVFAQWMHAYELEAETFYMMLETLTKVFPYYTIWNPQHTDLVIIASTGPYSMDFKKMETLIMSEPVKKDLDGLGIHSLLTILAMQINDKSAVSSNVKWLGQIHSDKFPKLDYEAPRGFFVGSSGEGVRLIDMRAASPVNAGLAISRYLKLKFSPTEEWRDAYLYSTRHPGMFKKLSMSMARGWFTAHPGDSGAQLAYAAQMAATHQAAISHLPDLIKGTNMLAFMAGKLSCRKRFEDYLEQRNWLSGPAFEPLAEDIGRLILDKHGKTDIELLIWAGELAYDRGKYTDAEKIMLDAFSLCMAGSENANPSNLMNAGEILCRSLLRQHKNREALEVAEKLCSILPGELKVFLLRAESLHTLADTRPALSP